MPPVCFSFERKADKSTRSVPSRQGQTFHRKVTKAARPPIIARSAKICCGSNKDIAAKGGKKAHGVCRPGRDKLSAKRKVSKGFNFVCAKLLPLWADSRFGKPQSFPVKETVLFFSLVRKEPKVHQRFANLWTPGTIQISARYEVLS